VRIQYFSDIHLEFGPLALAETRAKADLIVAAGDIGLGLQGLDWLKTLARPVIYVAGNHEFYLQEHAAAVAALRMESAGSNVRFLEQDLWLFEGVRFLGCTLWSDLGGQDNDHLEQLVQSVNDFRKIRYGKAALTPAHYLRFYQDSRSWLVSQLELPFPGPTVVVTHHAPTPWSWRENPSHIKRYAYCSDLKEILHSYEIAAWFHGHTHAVSDYRCAGARILCNPRGYLPDRLVAEFNPVQVVDI
jgi:predicted phosphodiesterase